MLTCFGCAGAVVWSSTSAAVVAANIQGRRIVKLGQVSGHPSFGPIRDEQLRAVAGSSFALKLSAFQMFFWDAVGMAADHRGSAPYKIIEGAVKFRDGRRVRVDDLFVIVELA